MLTPAQRKDCIAKIKRFPSDLAALVNNLPVEQLALSCPPEHPTLDGNWNIAQTIHHLADSHIRAYVRTKLILTENRPLLPTWEQEAWASLADATQTEISTSLSILRGLHQRWASTLEQLRPPAFAYVGIHPEFGELSIDHFVETYARHGHGHIQQIQIALRTSS